MKSINDIVRHQILQEMPQIEGWKDRERFINDAINAMDNTELLERISDAYSQFIKHPEGGEVNHIEAAAALLLIVSFGALCFAMGRWSKT